MTDYLSLAEVLAIQVDQINRYGGAHGVRDWRALESALFRAQSGYYNNLLEEAAALWESLAQNHPFLDGNKRTAFAATYTFLKINGFRIDPDWLSIYEFIDTLYKSNRFAYSELLVWLEKNAHSNVD